MKKLISVIVGLVFLGGIYGNTFAQMRYMSLGSYKISSINPITMDGVLAIQVQNDTIAFSMENVTGTIYKNGKKFVLITTKDIYFPSGESIIKVYGHIDKYDGTSIFDLIKSIMSFKINDYMVDISLKVRFSSGEIEIKERKSITSKNFRSIEKAP